MICVDEFGPLNLIPRPGRGWFRKGQPARRRATYSRTAGVRHMFARYIRWANRRATPKRHYAVNSKIRRPDYLPNVA